LLELVATAMPGLIYSLFKDLQMEVAAKES